MFDFADILTKIQDELCLLFFLSKHFSSVKCKRSLWFHCFFHYGHIHFNFFFSKPVSSSKSNLHNYKSQSVALRNQILIHSHLLVVWHCVSLFPPFHLHLADYKRKREKLPGMKMVSPTVACKRNA